MTDATVGSITAAVAVIAGLALVYGSFIGPRQTYLVQALVDALGVQSRYRPLVNFTVGVVLAMALSVFLAIYLNDWNILIFGVVAGIFASNSAADEHDRKTGANAIVTGYEVAKAEPTTVVSAPAVQASEQKPTQMKLPNQ